MQLSEDDEFKDLNMKNIVLYNIRKCIKMGSSKYLESHLLNENEYPLYIKMESAFFGKLEKLEEAEQCIGAPLCIANATWYILPKMILYGYIKEIIQKLAYFGIDERATLEKAISICATRVKLAEFGVYIEPFLMDFGLKRFLISDGVVINYDHICLSFNLSIDWINTYLNVSNIIKKWNCGAHTKISADLKIKWNREYCKLYVAKTTYINENADVKESKRTYC